MLRNREIKLEQDEVQMDLIKDLREFQDEIIDMDSPDLKSKDFAWFKKFL